MRHYEIVFLVHPDQSDQTQSVLNKFSSLVTDSGGTVHRLENIGRRKLTYPIQDQFKASYALMNIECSTKTIEEIKSSFKFNDSILRHLLVKTTNAETEPSKLFMSNNKESEVKKKEKSKDHKEKQKKDETDSKEDKIESSTENSSEESKKETEEEDEKSKE